MVNPGPFWLGLPIRLPLASRTDLPTVWTGDGFTTTVVVYLGIAILALLLTTTVLTLGKSVRAFRKDRERERLEDKLRPALRVRASDPEPEWTDWIPTLTEQERTVVADLLTEDMSLLEGKQKTRLQELGHALGLEEDAKDDLESASHYRRLHALKTLADLEAEVDPEWLARQVPDRRSEREAAVHVLAANPSPEAREVGIDLLFAEEPLSVYGIDGLHALVDENPAPLLRYLDDQPPSNPQLLSQILLVVQFAGMPSGDPPLDGILAGTNHDDPTIRERVFHVLATYGWHEDVREQVDVDAILEDPAVPVRSAAYRMFDDWGDDDARYMLSRAASREPDDRARVLIARGLQRKAPQSLSELRAEGTLSPSDRSWADIKHVIRRQPDPLR